MAGRAITLAATALDYVQYQVLYSTLGYHVCGIVKKHETPFAPNCIAHSACTATEIQHKYYFYRRFIGAHDHFGKVLLQ